MPPAPYLDPAQSGQRDSITQALMNIASPPPQMPQQQQPGMAPPQLGAPAPQAAPMPPQQGMPPQGAPMGAAQPPMMAGALGGLMQQPGQPQQPQPMPQQQMPPMGMPQG
jgi:hypothetical protein